MGAQRDSTPTRHIHQYLSCTILLHILLLNSFYSVGALKRLNPTQQALSKSAQHLSNPEFEWHGHDPSLRFGEDGETYHQTVIKRHTSQNP